MVSTLAVITPPSVEPATLADAKSHLRVDFTDDDARIQQCVSAARADLESIMERSIMTQQLRSTFDGFPRPQLWPRHFYDFARTRALLLRPPVQTIVSVDYDDVSGVNQALGNTEYRLVPDTSPGKLVPSYSAKQWPVAQVYEGAVQVTYQSGYGSTPGPISQGGSVPDNLYQAVLLLLGEYYENREQALIGSRLTVAELPHGVLALIQPLISEYLVA